ncbi:30S ribosomal protein S8 [Microgenomates group bacterium RBG_19FT_COMBO_39_10]|nr:ribosomal protein S8 [uncultured bacterium]OGV89201.1 MAG: 30S ribosomal protein S8 [Microgenomates group bacterium RBG_19FT_COMBO_39_10]
MTDPIGDLITRIKNGYAVRKRKFKVPYSATKENLAKILVKEGYLKEITVEGKKPQEKQLVVGLKYPHQEPAITNIERVSKPSLRVYLQAKKLKPIRSGFGMRILSTSKGLMTDKQAKKKKLGGEVICQLW